MLVCPKVWPRKHEFKLYISYQLDMKLWIINGVIPSNSGDMILYDNHHRLPCNYYLNILHNYDGGDPS